MKTINDVFARYKKELQHLYGNNEAEAITLLVISEVSEISKAKIKAFPETDITAPIANKLEAILVELKTGKPVQYVLGTTEFYGLIFMVDPSVLIPRPETEELVEWVISSVSNEQKSNVLDIGTGSGCIAISLKKNLPQFNISAVDISGDAIKTAESNAVLNKVDVNFIKQDILKYTEIELTKSNIIISNPPYVTLHDKTQMHTNVTDFEPHTALFVPENDPLIFYEAIADFALINLLPEGLLFFEINESYGEDIVKMLSDKSFKNIELRKDMSGRDRMVKAVKF